MERYIANLDSKLALREELAGGKGASLAWLRRNQFNIPQGFVITTNAFQDFLNDAGQVLHRKKDWTREDRERVRQLLNEFQIREELAKAILAHYRKLGGRVAVRSSMVGEDARSISFAGQLDTLLNVEGEAAVLQAVKRCWTSVLNWRLLNYMNEHKAALPEQMPSHLSIAVVVQAMIDAEIAGVAFSKNPINGSDEIVIEAVRGSAANLMRGNVTPGRWISRRGEWVAKPGADGIPENVIKQVAAETQTIAQTYGKPIDLEWAYDGKAINWVQLRHITTLENLQIYSNKLAKEMLPGMIKPLIWSVNIPLVNSAWVRLLTQVIGANNIDPQSLAKQFYYRAYFSMGTLGQIFQVLGFPRDSLELMMGIQEAGPQRPQFKPSRQTLRHIPRMIRFAIDKWNFASKIETFLPQMHQAYHAFPIKRVDQLDEQALSADIDKLWKLTQEVAYFNIVTPLLMSLYNAMLKSPLKKIGYELANVDLTKGMTELEQFYPNTHLKRLHAQFTSLDEKARERIRTGTYDDFRQMPGIDPFRNAIDAFIRQFGHLSDSGNDCSYVPWRENPDRILKMVTGFTESVSKHEQVAFEDLPMRGLTRWRTNLFYQRARKFRYYREAIGSLYTYGYGLFRPYFLALGNHFVRRGLIATRDDIFYLYLDEIRTAIANRESGKDYADQIARRKREMELYREVAVPSVIYGEQAPPIETAVTNKLHGTPTSGGYYRGPVKVIHGIDEFDHLLPGDVLVVSHSDIGWTPLFTKAGAVIAECGGMLSHSSIVAREFGIPAVVSVSNACQLKDHTIVTVDGHRGEIIVHESETPSVGEEAK
jgi:pyruvate,water dikinase